MTNKNTIIGVLGDNFTVEDGIVNVNSSAILSMNFSEHAGSNIIVNDDADGLAFASWNIITSSQAATNSKKYIANSTELVNITIPETCKVGDTIRVVGIGTGGWRILHSDSQYFIFLNSNTPLGMVGYIQSSYYRNCVELLCIEENVAFQVISAIGTLELSIAVIQ